MSWRSVQRHIAQHELANFEERAVLEEIRWSGRHGWLLGLLVGLVCGVVLVPVGHAVAVGNGRRRLRV